MRAGFWASCLLALLACGSGEVERGFLVDEQGVAIGDAVSIPPEETMVADVPATESGAGVSEAVESDTESGTDSDPEHDHEVRPDPDAVQAISFESLSLIGFDVDEILDYLLFPEEYEEGEIVFPEHIVKLDGLRVSLVGYMIPGELVGSEVTQFMLVRDLLACCFGGNPMPDEWIDVRMSEGESAAYLQYIPIRVTGRLSVGGTQDEEGYAEGLFQLVAETAVREDT